MGKFCSLFSGSDGNATYLSSGDTALLIDAGHNCKRILSSMEQRGLSPESVRGILLTHEHTDHVSALKVLLKKINVPVYATEGTLACLSYKNLLPAGAQTVCIHADEEFDVGEILVRPFSTPHDGAETVGYRFTVSDGVTSVAVATDMGVMKEHVRQQLRGCFGILLESNYDPAMLSACQRYTYPLKRRIASPVGHLSNSDCAGELTSLVKSGTTHFLLGHLSENTNYPELAFQTAVGELAACGMHLNTDYKLSVAPRGVPGEMILF